MNMNTLKSLPMKKRPVYILRTGFWPFCTALLLCFYVFALIWDAVEEKPLLNVQMINGCEQTENAEAFRPFLEDKGYGPTQLVSVGTQMQFPDSKQPLNCSADVLLFCNINSEQTDVFFWDSRHAHLPLVQNALVDLRGLVSDEVLEKYKDDLIYNLDEDEEDQYPCGIYLRSNDWVQSNHYYDSCAVGISESTKNPQVAADFLDYILG